MALTPSLPYFPSVRQLPIFFIVRSPSQIPQKFQWSHPNTYIQIFRETLEASIIISVLVSLIQSIVSRDEDSERASSLGSSDLQNEANNEGRPESPTINGEDELGGEEDSEARPLIRHRPRPTTRDGTSSEQEAETSEDLSTSTSCSEAQKMQNLVKKLRLQVGSISALHVKE